jgi:hypothetical protein
MVWCLTFDDTWFCVHKSSYVLVELKSVCSRTLLLTVWLVTGRQRTLLFLCCTVSSAYVLHAYIELQSRTVLAEFRLWMLVYAVVVANSEGLMLLGAPAV